MRTVYRYWITLLFVAVIAQIAAAAYGGFYAAQTLGDQEGEDAQKLISEKAFDHGFAFHTAFGYLIFLGAVVLFLLALAARLGKRRILFALAVPIAVDPDRARVGERVRARSWPLHRITALVIFGLTGYLTGQAWRDTREPAAVMQPTPAA